MNALAEAQIKRRLRAERNAKIVAKGGAAAVETKPMQIELKSYSFGTPLEADADVPDGKAGTFMLSCIPEFRDGKVVALWFDNYGYRFVLDGRNGVRVVSRPAMMVSDP